MLQVPDSERAVAAAQEAGSGGCSAAAGGAVKKEKELDKEEREIDAMINNALHGFGHSRQATPPACACTQTLLLFKCRI